MKIKIKYKMAFNCNDNLFVDFTVDIKNSKIISDTNVDDCVVLKDKLKEEIDLDNDRLETFLKDFKRINLKRSDKFFTFESSLFNIVRICDSQETEMYFIDGDDWWILGELLEKLVGFDILNRNNLKYLISKQNYDIEKDGVYDKLTKRKLKLKSLKYFKNHVMYPHAFPRISIDFEKVSDEIINNTLMLLEKYHIYQLEDKRYWKKVMHHSNLVTDGFKWKLCLEFEEGIYWTIGYSNEYPDIFTHLAEEIIELTGNDILDLKSVDEEDLNLYRQYGEEILRG